MDTIHTYADEKACWKNVREWKQRVHHPGQDNSKSVDVKDILESEYKGRCQLCGIHLLRDKNNPHFYRYRIAKPSDNNLSERLANCLCLCRNCSAELDFGASFGQDLSSVEENMREYVEYYRSYQSEMEMEGVFDRADSAVQEFTTEEVNNCFTNGIFLPVIVNGTEKTLVFSRRHFVEIAVLLYDTEEIEKESDSII